jgi:hypothetical protein
MFNVRGHRTHRGASAIAICRVGIEDKKIWKNIEIKCGMVAV